MEILYALTEKKICVFTKVAINEILDLAIFLGLKVQIPRCNFIFHYKCLQQMRKPHK